MDVTLTGFKAARVNGAALQVDQRARIDIQLQPGTVEESITVTASGMGRLETETSGLGEAIDTGQVKNLPCRREIFLTCLPSSAAFRAVEPQLGSTRPSCRSTEAGR